MGFFQFVKELSNKAIYTILRKMNRSFSLIYIILKDNSLGQTVVLHFLKDLSRKAIYEIYGKNEWL